MQAFITRKDKKIHVLGILLNSVQSILTFNSFDLYLKLGKVDGNKKERYHQTKFWKQIVYNINIIVVYLV